MFYIAQAISEKLIRFVAVCGFAIVIGTLPAHAEEYGTIVSEKLHMRSSPDRTQPSVKVLNKGERVKILGRHKGWVQVLYKDRIGYIRNRRRYVHIFTEKNTSAKIKKNITEIPVTAPAPTPDKPLTTYKKEAQTIESKIKVHRKEVQQFTQRETELIGRLNTIGRVVNRTRRRTRGLKTQIAGLDKKLAQARKQVQVLNRRIQTNEAYAARRLVALYKLNWVGRANVLASADSIYEMIQRKNSLERILAHDESVWQQLLHDKKEFTQLQNRLAAQKTRKIVLENEFSTQLKTMQGERTKRKRLLAAVRRQKSLQLAAIASLKKASLELDQIIAGFSPEPVVIKPDVGISPQRFAELKGLLKLPVSGKIVSIFGRYKNKKFNVDNFRNGVDIRADRGEPIRSVWQGRTLYSDWFKGYGNVIIIDHGENYYTVYAHAEELFKKQGDPVEANEVIATVGDTGSLIGPKLYFEVRHHGKPIDPMQWIR